MAVTAFGSTCSNYRAGSDREISGDITTRDSTHAKRRASSARSHALKATGQTMCHPGDACGNHLKRVSQDVNDVSEIVQPRLALFDEVASA
jgi:hypothetical protein